MLKFIWSLFKWAAILCILGYGIITVKTCYDSSQAGKVPTMPEMSKVPYELTIVSTGQILLTAKFETKSSSEAGKVIYSLPQGYWELKKNKFVYQKQPLSLDEHIFGSIELRRR